MRKAFDEKFLFDTFWQGWKLLLLRRRSFAHYLILFFTDDDEKKSHKEHPLSWNMPLKETRAWFTSGITQRASDDACYCPLYLRQYFTTKNPVVNGWSLSNDVTTMRTKLGQKRIEILAQAARGWVFRMFSILVSLNYAAKDRIVKRQIKKLIAELLQCSAILSKTRFSVFFLPIIVDQVNSIHQRLVVGVGLDRLRPGGGHGGRRWPRGRDDEVVLSWIWPNLVKDAQDSHFARARPLRGRGRGRLRCCILSGGRRCHGVQMTSQIFVAATTISRMLLHVSWDRSKREKCNK